MAHASPPPGLAGPRSTRFELLPGGTPQRPSQHGTAFAIVHAAHRVRAPRPHPGPPADEALRAAVAHRVLADLRRELQDARLGARELHFLRQQSRLAADSVLDGNLTGLFAPGGPRSTYDTVILHPQNLHDSVLMDGRPYGALNRTYSEVWPIEDERRERAVQRDDALRVLSLDSAVRAALGLSTSTTRPPGSAAYFDSEDWRHNLSTAVLLGNAVCAALTDVPFFVDLEHTDKMATSRKPKDIAGIAVLRQLSTTFQRLQRMGVMPGTVFLRRKLPDDAPGWTIVDMDYFGSSADHWSAVLSPDPLPGRGAVRQGAISALTTTAATVLGGGDGTSGWRAPGAPDIDPARPLDTFGALDAQVDQHLDRAAGKITFTGLADAPMPFEIHLPPLPPNASADEIARQDDQLRFLDGLCTMLFDTGGPLSFQRMPERLTLTDNQATVGTLVLARRRNGAWRLDDHGPDHVRHIFGENALSEGSRTPLARWRDFDTRHPLPPDTAPDASSKRLRLFVQVEDDPVIYKMAVTLARQFPQEMVWVQRDANGEYQVRRGASLLTNAPADAIVRVSLGGHGSTSPETKQRLLGGMTATQAAQLVSDLLPRLISRQPRLLVERTVLMSCALESPAVIGSFGAEFALAADARGWGRMGMETTVYSHTLVAGFGRTKLNEFTRQHPAAPLVRNGSGTRWNFWVDPATREVRKRDPFPNGNPDGWRGSLCCAVPHLDNETEEVVELRSVARLLLRPRREPSPTVRERALRRAVARDLVDLRKQFLALVRSFGLDGWHLLPKLITLPGGDLRATFIHQNMGTERHFTIKDDAQKRILVRTFSLFEDQLDEIGQRWRARLLDANAPDLLNVGLLAQTLKDLSTGKGGNSRFDKALMGLSLSSGGVLTAADVTQLAAAIRDADRLLQSQPADLLTRVLDRLSSTLRGLGFAGDLALMGMDVAALRRALAAGRQSAVSNASLRVGFDAGMLGLASASIGAEAAGMAATASVLGATAVPLSGLAVGLDGLQQAVLTEIDRLKHDMRPLHEIEKGYRQPLRIDRILLPGGGQLGVVLVNGWAPVNRIDFKTGRVGFAPAQLGSSAVHRNFYRLTTNGPLHEWDINDGASRQATEACQGQHRSLWEMMREADWPDLPERPMQAEWRDPGVLLLLMTPPNVWIDHDAYSSSRFGAGWAMLDDPLLDRMTANSDQAFVGDYVTSGSFARSADQWRFEQHPVTLDVVLDDQSRVLTLPAHGPADTTVFTFANGFAASDRPLRPLDQSKVDIRLIGGGGACALVLPSDGKVRGTVRLQPSGRSGERWTIALVGGLTDGGLPFEFLDNADGDGTIGGATPPVHGGASGGGFRFNQQTILVDAADAPEVLIVDGRLSGAGVLVNTDLRRAALVLDLGALDASGPGPDPVEAAAKALSAMTGKTPAGSSRGLVSMIDVDEAVLLTATLDGQRLHGRLDRASGTAVLVSQRSASVFLASTPGGSEDALTATESGGVPASASTSTPTTTESTAERTTGEAPRPSDRWTHYRAAEGAVMTLNADGLPVEVRPPPSSHLAPDAFVFDPATQRFLPQPRRLGPSGEAAVLSWLARAKQWNRAALDRFVASLAWAPNAPSAASVPTGTPPTATPRRTIHLTLAAPWTDEAAIRRAVDPDTLLELWVRLDRLSRWTGSETGADADVNADAGADADSSTGPRAHAAPDAGGSPAARPGPASRSKSKPKPGRKARSDKVPLDSDPTLAVDLAHAGFGQVAGMARVPKSAAGQAESSPSIGRKALDNARLAVLLLHAQQSGRLGGAWQVPGLPQLPTVERRTRLARLLTALADARAAAGSGATSIPLGRSTDVSETLVKQLDEELPLRIDGHDGPGIMAVRRDGAHVPYAASRATLDMMEKKLIAKRDEVRATGLWKHAARAKKIRGSDLYRELDKLAASPVRAERAPATPGEDEFVGLTRSLLHKVQAAGLTARVSDGPPTSAGAVQAIPPAPGMTGATGTAPAARVSRATLRLWMEQLIASGPPLDLWVARHAQGALLEALREVATEALLARISQARRLADDRQRAPLSLDAVENLQLATLIRAWLPDAPEPPRRPSAAEAARPSLPAGTAVDPDLPVAPGPQVFDPQAYHQWQARDPDPKQGQAYVYENPYTGKSELFRLHQTDAATGFYPNFPTDERSNDHWHYLGNTETLSAADLGALARKPTALRPQEFSFKQLDRWVRGLSTAWRSLDFDLLRLTAHGFEIRGLDGVHYQLADGVLTVELSGDNEGDTPFRLPQDAGYRALKRRGLLQRCPPQVLIQSNGREVDLDGLEAMAEDGLQRLEILAEADDRLRFIDLDDTGPGVTKALYEGLHLLLRNDRDPTGKALSVLSQRAPGPTVVIRDALVPSDGDPMRDPLVPDPRLILGRNTSQRVTPPPPRIALPAPLLELPTASFRLTTQSGDALLRAQDDSDQAQVERLGERLPRHGTTSDETMVYLRFKDAAGHWIDAAVSATAMRTLVGPPTPAASPAAQDSKKGAADDGIAQADTEDTAGEEDAGFAELHLGGRRIDPPDGHWTVRLSTRPGTSASPQPVPVARREGPDGVIDVPLRALQLIEAMAAFEPMSSVPGNALPLRQPAAPLAALAGSGQQ